jgi:hypothetical protein
MNKSSSRFYVYAYLRSKDSEHGKKGSPYYIGKGSGNRTKSNQGRAVNAPRDKDMVVYVQEGLTEQQAFSLERYCINLYGRVDLQTGCLRNKSDGGEGASGVVMTDERRQKISQAHKGKIVSAETRRKIGEAAKGRKQSLRTRQKRSEMSKGKNNNFFGRKHSDEIKQKLSTESAVYMYELVSPSGKKYVTHSLTLFASQHHLRQGCLSLVARGHREHHKGWKAKILEKLNDT